MTDENIKAINELAEETKRITDFAIGTIEREKRIMNAYIALMGVLLALLLGILVYTGYQAYTAPERGETMTMGAE